MLYNEYAICFSKCAESTLFCGASRVLLVSCRILLELLCSLCFFPLKRLTNESFEDDLAIVDLDCLKRMSLVHF